MFHSSVVIASFVQEYVLLRSVECQRSSPFFIRSPSSLPRACNQTFPHAFFDQRDVCYEPVTHVVQAAPHRTHAPVAVPSSPCVLQFFETLTAGLGNGGSPRIQPSWRKSVVCDSLSSATLYTARPVALVWPIGVFTGKAALSLAPDPMITSSCNASAPPLVHLLCLVHRNQSQT